MIALSRRGLLGSLLAAPVIIRTPGLLMPVKVLRPNEIIGYRIYAGSTAPYRLISEVRRNGEHWETTYGLSPVAAGLGDIRKMAAAPPPNLVRAAGWQIDMLQSLKA